VLDGPAAALDIPSIGLKAIGLEQAYLDVTRQAGIVPPAGDSLSRFRGASMRPAI